MQSTSALYKRIVSGEHSFETKVNLAGNELFESSIKSVATDKSTFVDKKPSIGGAIISTLNLVVIKPVFSIPRMAPIVVYTRAKNAIETSEWLIKGTYYIDTRTTSITSSGIQILSITAFDSMIKSEQDYPNTTHAWPYRDTLVLKEIADAMGVAIDARTYTFLTSAYMIDLPYSYTMRETLEHIAAANCGNFVITAENKLLFVPLYGLDPDIKGRYLADESSNALMFGNEGWFILV